MTLIPPPPHPNTVRPLSSVYPVAEDGLAPSLQGVSVVIPAYNESQAIASELRSLVDALSSIDPSIAWELIVVDDGSTDDTVEQARSVEHPALSVVQHLINRGYGAALKTGIRHSRYNWIAITDADGTYPAAHLVELLTQRDGNDMVVGARTTRDAQVPWLRRPAKWLLRRLASFLIERDIPDLNSGMRVMRRAVVERFEPILPNQFSFTTTITIAMLSAGFSVEYLPIRYLRRKGKSKIRPISAAVGFAALIVRTVMYFDPLRVFIPVAASFAFASIAVAAVSFAYGKLMDVTTVLLFVTAVQLMAAGMLADLVNRRGL